ncbi:hypothetical protein ACFP81_09285 [Deinococcus lacus]|uniref:Uncharacterized protein n=1 Tax=Deinococcus lacus TaxID=392561 RepID=A0ABW1YCX8_9DEIO
MNYFQSTRHLVGLALAGLGLAAHFLGYLDAYWIPIVLGLYAFGALVTPRTRADVQLERLAGEQELRGDLQEFLRRSRPQLPADVGAHLDGIAAQLEDLLPRLHELELQGDHNAFTVRQVMTDYLPETVNNYLRLPRRYAQTHRLEDGRTPHAVMLDQLTLLHSTLEQVTVSVAQGDTGQMLANGRFLRDKFGTPDLKL